MQSAYRVCRDKKNWENHSAANKLTRKCLHLENEGEYLLKSYDKSCDKVIRVLDELDHPNVIQIHEILDGRDSIEIIFQDFNGIKLSEELQSRENRKFDDCESYELVSQIISASRYLLHNKYFRQYPTLENISIKKNSFGYRLRVTELSSPIVYTNGSELFIDDNDFEKYTLFHIGLIAYSLVSGIYPVAIKGAESELMNSILNHEEFRNLTSNSRDFISKCFSSFKLSHINAETIQRHPWLQFGDRFNEPILSTSLLLLARYQMESLLSRIFRLSLSNSLDTMNIGNIHSEFLKFDRQGLGLIDCHDFIKIFHNVGETVAREIFSAINIKRTGYISYHEFIAAMMNDGDISEINLRNTFRQLCRPNQKTIMMEDIECNLSDNYSIIDITKMYSEVGLTITSTISFDQVYIIYLIIIQIYSVHFLFSYLVFETCWFS